jgi:hypothetical protein
MILEIVLCLSGVVLLTTIVLLYLRKPPPPPPDVEMRVIFEPEGWEHI